jgi:hypothetical protein
MTDQEKILKLQTDVAKLGIEQQATELFLAEIFKTYGLDADQCMARLETMKKQRWDSFLVGVENMNPALAAAVDKRTIAQIPTDC